MLDAFAYAGIITSSLKAAIINRVTAALPASRLEKFSQYPFLSSSFSRSAFAAAMICSGFIPIASAIFAAA
jgi:hypothetical protein